MILTEAEARTKWCPNTQVSAADANASYATNREGFARRGLKGYDYCIASDCMAWRWTIGPMKGDTKDVQYKGYCGLAGKP